MKNDLFLLYYYSTDILLYSLLVILLNLLYFYFYIFPYLEYSLKSAKKLPRNSYYQISIKNRNLESFNIYHHY